MNKVSLFMTFMISEEVLTLQVLNTRYIVKQKLIVAYIQCNCDHFHALNISPDVQIYEFPYIHSYERNFYSKKIKTDQ